MASTQEYLPIKSIHDNVVVTTDGNIVVVLETSAVNFGLLSDKEQLAIIYSFAGLLNSLSFAIQIVVRSKRLNIQSYLNQLDTAQMKQTNPLLKTLISHYQDFIKVTTLENEVLDKQFFIAVPVSFLEVGVSKNIEGNFKKAMTILIPRRDHLIRQLARIGLKAKQLNSEDLVKLFYDIYNEGEEEVSQDVPTPEVLQPPPASLNRSEPQAPPASANTAFVSPQTSPVSFQSPSSQPPLVVNQRRSSPLVVEELPEDYGTT